MTELALTIPHLLVLALTACMLWVIYSDLTHYIISNQLNVVLVVLYGIGAVLVPLPDWLPALGAMAVMLAFGMGLFALGLMGGGDVKLLASLALWTGWGIETLQLIFLTAISGGVLVIVVILARRIIAPIMQKRQPERVLPRILSRKQPVPYGLAIAVAFVWMLWTGAVPGLV